jgi:NADH dehydrogenase
MVLRTTGGVIMKKKVIIIGSGFAGLSAAKELGNSDFDVLVIDKANHHLFQPLLYQVASAALSPGDIAIPIREALSKYKNIKVIQSTVSKIDKEEKYLEIDTNKQYFFDYLIVAVGSKPHYYKNPEWQEFAPGLKTLNDALKIRNQVLTSFEKAEISNKPYEREALLNFVVVGGGPTGVELAGAFAEIAKKTLINDFRHIKSADAKIYLIEGGDRILNSFHSSLSKDAENYLKELGVIVLKGDNVKEITKNEINISNKKIATKNIVWAAGNRVSTLLKQLGTGQDHMGRVKVNKNLNIANSKSIFVLGDAAYFEDRKGRPLPSLAPVASQQGKYVAKWILGKTHRDFKYLDKGAMATIGRTKAIAEFGAIRIKGIIAWFAWCFIHILFLINFRNRFKVFIQWALAFFFFKRGVRIINSTKSNKEI